MRFSIEAIGHFKREAKRLIKKYPSLREEIEYLGKELKENPFTGIALRDGF